MLKKILVFTCFTLSIGVNAAPIYNYDGVNYEIRTLVTSFAADEGLLMSQFWWGDENLAESVASASGPEIVGSESGVAFMYDNELYSLLGWLGASVRYEPDVDNCCYSDPHLQGFFASSDYEQVYAIATVSDVPLPATAWLVGSALFGLGAMRRKNA